MPDSERLQKLSINWPQQKGGKLINKQNKSKASNGFKNNPHINNKIKQEIDYFIAGSGTEDDKVTSAETTLKIHNE